MTTYWLLGENGSSNKANKMNFGEMSFSKDVISDETTPELSVVEEESTNGRGEQAILLEDHLPLDIQQLQIGQESENL